MLKVNKKILFHFCEILLILILLPSIAFAKDLHYYYFEAENYKEASGIDFRDEGFTSWMAHPSNGKTVICGENAILKYDLSKLVDGEYFLFIRHLAFPKPQASVEAFADDTSMGVTGFERPGTYLAWSQKLGPFKKQDKTRLTIKVAQGNIQASYLDVLLLTDDPDFIPDNTDQDFKSSILTLDENDLQFNNLKMNPVLGKTGASLSVNNKSQINRSLLAKISASEPVLKETLSEQETFILKPGDDTIRLTFKGLANRKYIVTTAILNEKDQTIFRKVTLCAVVDPIEVKVNGICFSDGEDVTVKLKINDNDLASRKKVFEVRLAKTGTKASSALPFMRKVEATGDKAEMVIPLKGLVNGKYELNTKILGLDQSSRQFILTKIPIPEEKLEDIKVVTLKDRAIWVNGRPFVPRKLYHAGGSKVTKSQGFNVVDCWGGDTLEGIEKMLDEAHANNLYGYGILFHPYFFKGADKGFDHEALKTGINRLKNHPALLLYELYDEPDAGIPLKYMLEAYALIKELDPNHPVLLNFCCPPRYREYSVAADVVSMDCYPIPAYPVTTVSDYMDQLDAACDSKKPMQIALQTYGDVKGRMPTPEELKCMTYLSINHGAKSLSFYSYWEAGDYPYCLYADTILWSYMRELNQELITLKEAIIALAKPSLVTASTAAIDFSARRVGDQVYVIAANKEKKETRATLEFKKTIDYKQVKVLFEDRNLPVTRTANANISLTDAFKPLEVHVYVLR